MNFLTAHYSIQTDFMVDRFLDIGSKLERTEKSLLTDGTHSFFKEGYLLTSVVYCNRINRYIPILFRWIAGLTVEHHLPHFRRLVRLVFDNLETEKEQDDLLRSVIDYSVAITEKFTVEDQKDIDPMKRKKEGRIMFAI